MRELSFAGFAPATEGGATRSTPPRPATTPSGSAKACTEGDVQELVASFVQAFNRGDSDVLDCLFAPERGFEWYSTDGPGERLRDAAYDRSTLVRYFDARHERKERLRFRSFRFGGNADVPAGEDPYGNFEYALVRSADDLEPTRYHGKGAARCYEGGNVIIVWSMGRE